MSNSGKSVSDRRQRRPRVAPRRHTEPGNPVAGGAYDSPEFPVLLRMPDVTHAESSSVPVVNAGGLASAGLASGGMGGPSVAIASGTRSGNPTEAGTDTGSSPAARTIRGPRQESIPSGSGKQSEPHEPEPKPIDARVASRRPRDEAPQEAPIASEEPRGTAEGVARFWSLIPPQVAAGGMLLAVVALCFVLLSDSGTGEKSVNDTTTPWGEGATASPAHIANSSVVPAATSPEATSPEAQRSTVETPIVGSMGAPVPVAPRLAAQPKVPDFDVTPVQEPEATVREASPSVGTEGWPVDVAPRDNSDVEEDSAPVAGWPDESAGPTTSEVDLNSPIESARRATLPTLRTSQRNRYEDSTGAGPSLGTVEQPQLSGTIEIPPPTKLYRQ